jgi:hypothetical protein
LALPVCNEVYDESRGTMKFTFYWRDGKREVLDGKDPADAMNKRGYGNGALRALDFYSRGENNEYAWNPTEREWKPAPL